MNADTQRCIRKSELVGSPATHYRNRMVYDLRARLAAPSCELSLPSLWAARCELLWWAVERSCMPLGFYREVTVREGWGGTLQLKLLLQSRDGDPVSTDLLWPHERSLLVCHLRQQLPLLRSLSMQVAFGKARPPKDEPCTLLWGELCLHQQDPTFLIGPETFCQVNHHTGLALFSAVAGWLRLPDVTVGCHEAVLVTGRDVNMFGTGLFGSDAPVSAGSACHRGNLARGAGQSALSNIAGSMPCTQNARIQCAQVTLLTHCPNAYADAQRNLSVASAAAVCVRLGVRAGCSSAGAAGAAGAASVSATLTLRPPQCGEAFLAPKCETSALVASLGAAALPPRLAIATAGRSGVGRAVCAELKRLPLRALVYVACCLDTAAADISLLLGGDGFCVAASLRFDHFPATGHQGAAILLLRRPPSLLLPVGPSGSGKSTLCRALAAGLPQCTVNNIERDAIYAARRAAGAGVKHARRGTMADVCAALQVGAAVGALCIVDSCNARTEGRAFYMRQHQPRQHPPSTQRARGDSGSGSSDRKGLVVQTGTQSPRCVLLSFDPHPAEGGETDSLLEGGKSPASQAAHRAMLLERVRARAWTEGHPTFPVDDEPQQQALDGTLAAMEWPTRAEVRARGQRLIRVDPHVAVERQLSALLESVFEVFWWPRELSSGDCADGTQQAVDGRVTAVALAAASNDLSDDNLVHPMHSPL